MQWYIGNGNDYENGNENDVDFQNENDIKKMLSKTYKNENVKKNEKITWIPVL